MKPFDIELARQGKPVVTREGKPARIICFDKKIAQGDFTLVTLVSISQTVESLYSHTSKGRFVDNETNSAYDLFMASEKREGWVNIYSNSPYIELPPSEINRIMGFRIYKTKELALRNASPTAVTTIKIEWEE